MALYAVDINVTCRASVTIEVEADSEDEAAGLAVSRLDTYKALSDGDEEIDIECIDLISEEGDEG